MSSKFEQLLGQVHEVADLGAALSVLHWDQETNMPSAGTAGRASQIGTLSKIQHERATSPEMGDLIAAAAEEQSEAAYDSFEASLIRVLQRDYAIATKLPADYVVRSAQIGVQATEAWREARKENDFEAFAPWLDKVIGLGQERADYLGVGQEFDEKYDILLDLYEEGAKTAEVRAVFDAVKAETVPLLQAIREKGKAVETEFLHRNFPIAAQKKFARYIAGKVGFDFKRGHLGTVTHPFATSFGINDVRITTRWHDDFLNPALFGVLHESGHAIYEQGVGSELARTPLASGTSMGIHESQSRLIENVVGRSWGFWQAHYGALQSHYPEALGDISLDEFYRGINKVEPSLIRVEADELTYNLHIILRFELEQGMVNGEIKAQDVPVLWNDKMISLLGIAPQTDSEGCLQDVHWSGPSFGYFPTYALGNLYASQLMAAALSQNSAIGDEMERGETTGLLAWLKSNIHQHGSKYPPQELIVRTTGKKLTHKPYIDYVTAKFSHIYAL